MSLWCNLVFCGKWGFIFLTPSLQFERSLLVLSDSGQMKVWILPSNISGRSSPEGSSRAKCDPVPKSTVVTVHPLATLPYLCANASIFILEFIMN